MNKTQPNFSKVIDALNIMAEEELNPQPSRLTCSTSQHTSDLPNTKLGSKCICNGIWQLTKGL